MDNLMKKLVSKTKLNKSQYIWSRILHCLPMEVYIGDYKYNNVDGCKYVAIIGNADFSDVQNLKLDKLEYIQGNLKVQDAQNLNFLNLNKIGGNLVLNSAYGINLNNLEYAPRVEMINCIVSGLRKLSTPRKDIYIKDSFIGEKSPYANFMEQEF